MATKKETETKPVETKETGTKAEDQPWNNPEKEEKADAKDALDSNEGSELTAIAVKSLTNIEEKVEAIDWKLWEIYNIVKNYVESNPEGVSAPPVAQPQASAADIASEIAKTLGEEPKEKKSVVGKLFGK